MCGTRLSGAWASIAIDDRQHPRWQDSEVLVQATRKYHSQWDFLHRRSDNSSASSSTLGHMECTLSQERMRRALETLKQV
jgi:hypothetical protein